MSVRIGKAIKFAYVQVLVLTVAALWKGCTQQASRPAGESWLLTSSRPTGPSMLAFLLPKLLRPSACSCPFTPEWEKLRPSRCWPRWNKRTAVDDVDSTTLLAMFPGLPGNVANSSSPRVQAPVGGQK